MPKPNASLVPRVSVRATTPSGETVRARRWPATSVATSAAAAAAAKMSESVLVLCAGTSRTSKSLGFPAAAPNAARAVILSSGATNVPVAARVLASAECEEDALAAVVVVAAWDGAVVAWTMGVCVMEA